jgi:hypothetical protein
VVGVEKQECHDRSSREVSNPIMVKMDEDVGMRSMSQVS